MLAIDFAGVPLLLVAVSCNLIYKRVNVCHKYTSTGLLLHAVNGNTVAYLPVYALYGYQ